MQVMYEVDAEIFFVNPGSDSSGIKSIYY